MSVFEGTVTQDLLDVIGGAAADEPHYCGTHYVVWEVLTAKPLLEAQGYEWLRAYTSEGDSFGPLIRTIVARKDGVRYELYYG